MLKNNKLEKKHVSVKEFEAIYSVDTETQKSLRNRSKHPLPYIQIVKNGKITYLVLLIDKWFENYMHNV